MPTITNYNSSFAKNFREYVLYMDIFIHRSLGKLFRSMPGDDKNPAGFLLLCVIATCIAGADVAVGWAISLRPLFVFPIVLASIYLSRPYAYAIALLVSLLRVESFRVSTLPDGEAFPFFLNFFPALVASVAIAEFGSLATNTIRELVDYINALQEELALERIGGMDLDAVVEEEVEEASQSQL